jgi:carbonic anhydrase
VLEQVNNLAKTTIVQKSWQQKKYPHLHGWVFDLHHGEIKEILNINAGEWNNPVFQYQF